MFELRNIVGAELIHFMKRIGVPVGIKVHQRGEGPGTQPARLNGGMRFTQDWTCGHDDVRTDNGIPRIAYRYNFNAQLRAHLQSVSRAAIEMGVISVNLLNRKKDLKGFKIAAALYSASQDAGSF